MSASTSTATTEKRVVPELSPDVAKDLHNVPYAYFEERQRAMNSNPPPKQKRFSFGAASGDRGRSLFSNLEAAKSRRMSDGYEDMTPKKGIVEGVFRNLVGAKHQVGNESKR